jgi:ABC-type Fe3+-hydroxamate transport system substrate-binding protein
MAGKPLRRLSLLTLFPVLLMLLATPAHATQSAPTDQAPPRTELLHPAITLDQTTGPVTVTQVLGQVLTAPAEPPRTGPGPGSRDLLATAAGLLIVGLVSVTAARRRARTA